MFSYVHSTVIHQRHDLPDQSKVIQGVLKVLDLIEITVTLQQPILQHLIHYY